ncbi:MAG: CmcI family methyltransferase [Bryobacteraceae bacterium]
MRSLAVLALAFALSGCSGSRVRPAPPGTSRLQLRELGIEPRLLKGFYPPEGDWRWTAQEFAVSLDAPSGEGDVFLEADFGLSPELAAQGLPVSLSVRANGVHIGVETYAKPERYIFSKKVPAAALRQLPVRVELALDKSFARPGDGRRQGVQVVSISLVPLEESRDFRRAKAVLAREAYEQAAARRRAPLTPEQDFQFMRLYHDTGIWQHLSINNVPIMKNPLDLWAMQQIAYEIRPDFIVETGTAYGGSTLFWAQTLNGLGLNHARVLTVDITDSRQAAATDPLWKKYVDFYLGSSTDPAIVAEIRKRVRGGKTMVALDSDHRRAHVLRELRMYSPMVSRGAYLIVEDGNIDGIPTNPAEGPGPMAALAEWLSEGGREQFEQDFSREAMAITFNPGGWLRRK